MPDAAAWYVCQFQWSALSSGLGALDPKWQARSIQSELSQNVSLGRGYIITSSCRSPPQHTQAMSNHFIGRTSESCNSTIQPHTPGGWQEHLHPVSAKLHEHLQRVSMLKKSGILNCEIEQTEWKKLLLCKQHILAFQPFLSVKLVKSMHFGLRDLVRRSEWRGEMSERGKASWGSLYINRVHGHLFTKLLA